MSKEEYVLKSVKSFLNSKGFESIEIRMEPDSDQFSQRSSAALVVEVKVAHVYRSKVFPAIIGDVILRANHEGISNLMLAILIKRINRKAIENLEGYTAEYRKDLNWFLLDEGGFGEVCLHGQRFRIKMEPYLEKLTGLRNVSSQGGNLFSPNNQWLLKMLLLPGISSNYWGGPNQRPRSIMELSRMAGVSQPSVSSFMKRMEHNEYIKRKSDELVVIRHRELLDDWFYAQKYGSRDEISVRSMYGDSVDAIVNKIGKDPGDKQRPEVILGHHLACHHHGLGRASVKVAKLYSNLPVKMIMHRLHLVEEPSSSPVSLLVQKCPIYVQRGFVRINGIPVCDILQCYLDVRKSRARGKEQSEYIYENVLAPHFEMKL